MGAMERPVKARPYDASRRKAESARTRARILEAARGLILASGWRATTIANIAEAAEVNVDTVYELVGRKGVVLRELIEQAISGTDHRVVAEERDYVKALQAERDPASKLRIYARAVTDIQERMAPLFAALADASATDPEAAAVWRQISQRRAANMRKLIADLRDAGGLRPGLSVDEAADVVWAMNGSEFYLLLTAGRGWSPEQFEAWLADSWCRLLLP
jgi:AcrR family transcriptional regulator